MSLIHWSPSLDPFQEMEEVMKTMMPVSSQSLHKGFVPAIDVYETKDAVMVETPLPGVNPKDVQIQVDAGVLTLRGESKREHEVDEKNYYRKEVRSGSFYRQVQLPVVVDEDKIEAVFDGGVLRITCPKLGETRAKKIDIQIREK